MSELEKIWEKTDRSGDCWIWQGTVDKNGYGLARVAGKTTRIPRAVWRFVKGEDITPAQNVLHRCDNPACLNPDHLFIGSHAQNMADMAKKGRANRPTGELNGRARLTKEQADSIRKESAEGASQTQLAEKYRVSRGAIYHTLANRTWN